MICKISANTVIKKLLTYRVYLLLGFLMTACSNEQEARNISVQQTDSTKEQEFSKKQYTEPHLGTSIRIVFYTRKPEDANALAKRCFDKVRELNAIFSDYEPNSEVSQLSKKALHTPHKVSDDLFSIIKTSQQISKATEGAFDITLGQLTKRWRKLAKLHKIPQKNTTETEEIHNVNYTNLQLNSQKQTITMSKRVSIDLGGIAKGYIADQLISILKKANINHSGVLIGGEIVVADPPPGKSGWSIGIEDPAYKTVGKINLNNASMSTSGDSYQFYETEGVRHAHVIDPIKKQSKSDRLNVTVISSSGTLADAWATALRVSSKNKAMSLANDNKIKAAFLSLSKPVTLSNTFPKITPSAP